MYKYSICLPVFNGEKYIEKAINSVIEQEYQNWELIVYDNGSSDDTFKIISKFEDHRIKIVRESKKVSEAIPAWHKAMNMASGDFTLMLGHDDWFKPDFIKIANDLIIKFNLDVFSGWTDSYDENYNFIEIVTSASFIQSIPNLKSEENIKIFDGKGYLSGFLKDFEKGFSKMHLSTTMIRTSIYKEIGGFNIKLKYCAESELYLKLAKINAKFGFYWGKSLVNYIGEGIDRRAFFLDITDKYHDFYLIPKIMFDNFMIDKKYYNQLINLINKRAVNQGFGYPISIMLNNINRYTKNYLLIWNIISIPISLWVRLKRIIDYTIILTLNKLF